MAAAKRLSDKTLRARETRWDDVGAGLSAAILLLGLVGLWVSSRYILDTDLGGKRPGATDTGLALGVLTVLLYAIAAAYSWRHRRRVQQRGMTRVWMEIHLAFGTVSGVAAVLHSGPSLGAPLHAAFLVAWELLVLSGIVGKIISVVVPRRLTRIEDDAMLVEDVVDRQRAVRTEIEQLLQGAAAEVVDFVNTHIPRSVRSPDWYGARRMRRAEVVESVWQAIDVNGLRDRGVVSADKVDWLKRVVTCHVEERFLDRMLTYHFVLRGWLPVHIALTTLCFPWLVVHVVTVFML